MSKLDKVVARKQKAESDMWWRGKLATLTENRRFGDAVSAIPRGDKLAKLRAAARKVIRAAR
jgi:hypothetical protein